MAPEATRNHAVPEPLDAALAVQLARLERVAVRGLQVLCVGGVVLGLVVGATLSRALGFGSAATSAVLLVWFLVYGRLLERGGGGRALRTVSTLVESAIPWAFFGVIAAREGALYALASWVPPMLFCALMIAYAARLRPRACLMLGVVSAITYPVIYFVAVRDLIPAGPRILVVEPPMQVARAFTLLFAGALGAAVARGMKGAIARAGTAAREQDLFGKYRLVRQVASGGMGLVFEALYCPEGGFERRVAVKRIHPHLAADPKFVDAFRDEAELTARLAHPGIVQVLDFGRVADSFFLAMEYVDGMTLGALVFRMKAQGARLSPGVVGYVARAILEALVHAHQGARGPDGRPLRVVHRDLCPPNVLVSQNGEVKVTDFGIARSLHDARVSTTQNVAGHVGYMAPEQARADAFDTRADLFPVAVMVWELFTLRPLFRRKTEAASLTALLTDRVLPVTVDRADLDPAWATWIERGVAREPSARFATATAMLEALDAIPEARDAHAQEELAALVRRLRGMPRVVEPSSDEAPTLVAPCGRAP